MNDAKARGPDPRATLEALLAAPDRRTWTGRRDHALLLLAVQTGLRDLMGWQSARDYWFPEVRTRGASVLVLSGALYPYVYLLARAAFQRVVAGPAVQHVVAFAADQPTSARPSAAIRASSSRT